MPVRTPGSTTSASKPKYRSVISRSAAVTRGTPDAMATPDTCASKEKPFCDGSHKTCGFIGDQAAPGPKKMPDPPPPAG